MGIDAAVNPDALHSSVLSSSVAAHIHAGKSQEGTGQTAALYTVPPFFFLARIFAVTLLRRLHHQLACQQTLLNVSAHHTHS